MYQIPPFSFLQVVKGHAENDDNDDNDKEVVYETNTHTHPRPWTISFVCTTGYTLCKNEAFTLCELRLIT